MKRTITILRLLYATELLTAALLLVIFESGLITPGLLAGDDATNYIMTMVGVALTIIHIPLALKFLTFKRIKEQIHADEQRYTQYAIVRIALLSVPLIYNTLAYEMLGCEPTCGYLALMVVVAFVFIWPTEDKICYERESEYNQKED